MSALIYCESCDTPLLTSLKLEKSAIYSAFLMSHLAMRDDGYALNVCRRDANNVARCPICKANTLGPGNPPPRIGQRVECNGILDSRCIEFLRRHALVHLRHDLDMAKRQDMYISARYAFGYVALRHFALAGTLSVFNGAIGAMALLSPQTSVDSLRYLAEIVSNETGETISPYQITVDAFSIQGGSCVVLTMPFPKAPPEPHLIGIATNANIHNADAAKPTDKQIEVLYFSLEHTRLHEGKATIFGKWMHDGRKNYGFGPNPYLEDFIECIERLWVSEIWRS